MKCRTKAMTRLKFSLLAPELLGCELVSPPSAVAPEVGGGGDAGSLEKPPEGQNHSQQVEWVDQ